MLHFCSQTSTHVTWQDMYECKSNRHLRFVNLFIANQLQINLTGSISNLVKSKIKSGQSRNIFGFGNWRHQLNSVHEIHFLSLLPKVLISQYPLENVHSLSTMFSKDVQRFSTPGGVREVFWLMIFDFLRRFCFGVNFSWQNWKIHIFALI